MSSFNGRCEIQLLESTICRRSEDYLNDTVHWISLLNESSFDRGLAQRRKMAVLEAIPIKT